MMVLRHSPDRNAPHIPVLMEEVLQYLAPKDEEIYVDGTFGAGGYTRNILESAACHVYGIDRDPSVKPIAAQVTQDFPGRFTFCQGTFATMEGLLAEHNLRQVHGIVLDIGVSSMQLDQADRGFSFMRDGPLDMRMGQQGMDVATLLATIEEKELADIIYRYGEEHRSRHVARAIVETRKEVPITRTIQLADIVSRVVRKSADGLHPATRTFQALRIWINEELRELEDALHAAERLLAPGGRLVVVSFHSLEDSIVKAFMKEAAGQIAGVSRHVPVIEKEAAVPVFDMLTRKAVTPGDQETQFNIRARSARLRAAKRTNAPVRSTRRMIEGER